MESDTGYASSNRSDSSSHEYSRMQRMLRANMEIEAQNGAGPSGQRGRSPIRGVSGNLGSGTQSGGNAASSSQLPVWNVNKGARHTVVCKKAADYTQIVYLSVKDICLSWDRQQPLCSRWNHGKTSLIVHKMTMFNRSGFSVLKPHLPVEVAERDPPIFNCSAQSMHIRLSTSEGNMMTDFATYSSTVWANRTLQADTSTADGNIALLGWQCLSVGLNSGVLLDDNMWIYVDCSIRRTEPVTDIVAGLVTQEEVDEGIKMRKIAKLKALTMPVLDD